MRPREPMHFVHDGMREGCASVIQETLRRLQRKLH